MSKFIKLGALTRFWNNVQAYITNALAGKADTGHTHDYAATNHTHDYAASAHGHAQADVTGLVEALAGKAAATHGHAQTDITGLVDALASKAAADHTHGNYAATGHTHSDYALKADLTTVYRYKGTVASVDALPTTAEVGDVYNVEGDNGQNYAWTGTSWDALGGSIQIEVATDDDIDALFE